MPLTHKGKEIMSKMKEEYGGKKAEQVFYASRNKGTIKGVDPSSMSDSIHSYMDACSRGDCEGMKRPLK